MTAPQCQRCACKAPAEAEEPAREPSAEEDGHGR